MYSKRTEVTTAGHSSVPRPPTDSSYVVDARYSQARGSTDNSYQARQQSPSSRAVQVANVQSNQSAGATTGKQTFYMADRLKKHSNPIPGVYLKNHNRHGSADENSTSSQSPTKAVVIHSTNDSRVEDLPAMGARQNTKSVQMRSTMYNSNNSYFQKLVQNFQASGATTKTAKGTAEEINLTDKKRVEVSKEAAGALI